MALVFETDDCACSGMDAYNRLGLVHCHPLLANVNDRIRMIQPERKSPQRSTQRSPQRSPRTRIFVALAWLCGLSCGWSPSLAVDAIVVRPAGWHVALQPWLAHRAAQGLKVVEIDSNMDRDVIRAEIARLYAAHSERLKFVLLAADVSANKDTTIPTFYKKSAAMVQFGGDPLIATDNPYVDFDGDDNPELAIGRIPADSSQQLANTLGRIIAYENSQDFSSWRRDVHVVAGVGGFGAVADSVIEMTTRRFLADRIPGWSELSMTQASTGSHYCPDPWRFSEACIDRFNQGGMFWVYIGHGHVKTLDYMRVQDQFLPILNQAHVPVVQTGDRPPIAIFMACYTGAFDTIEDSLAEELLLSGTGPVAAIASSRVAGPYGLATLADGLLTNFYVDQSPTLGEIVLNAKHQMLAEATATENEHENTSKTDETQMQMITAIASALSPEKYDLRAERLEHIWQIHLLGDPMMRVQHPTDMALQVPTQSSPGGKILVEGKCQVPGQLTVELAFRREQVRRELDNLTGDLKTQEGRDRHQERYVAANNRILVSRQTQQGPGSFAIELETPTDLPRGKYCVRAYLQGETCFEVGYAELLVRPPKQ